MAISPLVGAPCGDSDIFFCHLLLSEIMLYVEIQRGKKDMNGEKFGKYAKDIGPTAAFVKRAVEETANCGTKLKERRDAVEKKKSDFYNGDSWFAGVTAAIAAQDLGHEFFCPVKTNTAGFSIEKINEWMKDWPSGSYIVLECEEHRLFAVGYKYSLRSKSECVLCFVFFFSQCHPQFSPLAVLSFIGSWNAGATTPGKPYIARFPDSLGNLQSKEILRPDVVSGYFADSDKVDCVNKSRQGDLALEELWRTNDCWLILCTTFIGITVTDTWNSVRHHCTEESEFPVMPISRFAECLVFDLWNKPWGEKRSNVLVLGMPDVVDDEFEGVEVVAGTPSGSLERVKKEHVLGRTERRENPDNNDPGVRHDRIRRTCHVGAKGCHSKEGKKKVTMWECMHPDCMKKEYQVNRKIAKGTFICENPLCLSTHCLQVWNERTQKEEEEE